MATSVTPVWQFHLKLHGNFTYCYMAILFLHAWQFSSISNHCIFLFNQDKISDVKSMNWCKFIADFIHEAFSKNMYQKGSRLYLMASLPFFFATFFTVFSSVFTFLF